MATDYLRRNNVSVTGSGPATMVFAHGFGCDQSMWRHVTPAFEKEYKVVLFDYVGAGGSDLNSYNFERYRSLDGYAADVLEVCESLQLHQTIFVGHSVSGMIGLLAAIRRPALFNCLIMIGPSPCYINDPPDYVGGFTHADIDDLLDMMDKNYLGWANSMAPVVMKNNDHPELSAELERSFLAADPDLALNFAQATFLSDNREILPRAPIPSLILQCAEDVVAPAPVGEYLHSQLPDSTLKFMEATGHFPHLSHPVETIKLINEYLEERKQGTVTT